MNKLQVMAAEISGKETALYVSSGTQSNLCAILAQCWERGAEIFVGDKSHIALYEQGNVSQFGGVLVRSVPNQADGSFDLAYLETLLHGVEDAHFPNARLICIEASHNMCGGTVPTLEWLGKCRAFASKHNLRIHLDAARGFNATAYHGITIEKLCSFADSVSICTSKGLTRFSCNIRPTLPEKDLVHQSVPYSAQMRQHSNELIACEKRLAVACDRRASLPLGVSVSLQL